MNCYECALRGESAAAVATCGHCGVGMCLEHLREAQSHRVGGTLYGCPHDLSAAAMMLRTAAAVRSNGQVRALADDPVLLRRAALEQRHLRPIRDALATRAWRVPWRVGGRTFPREPLSRQPELTTGKT